MAITDVPKCTAMRRSDGQPCRALAVTGLAVCRMHGGASKRSKEAGLRRRAAGIDPHAPKVSDIPRRDFVDVETAALATLAQTLRLTEFVGNVVEQYDAGQFLVRDSEVGTRTAPMVELLRGLLGDANKWAQSAMRLRLEDRRLKVEAARSDWIVGVVADALARARDDGQLTSAGYLAVIDAIATGLSAGRAPSAELVGMGACGTEGGRMKHRERGEEACDACKGAYNEAQARRASAHGEARRNMGRVLDVASSEVQGL